MTLWLPRSAAGITRRWPRSTAVTVAQSGPSLGMSAGAELAKEVCQAVFTELWSRPEHFDPAGGRLRSWLVAQARARAVHVARSHDADRHQDGDARTEHMPPSAEVEIAVHARALTEKGRRAIDQVVPAERETILLAYFGGHTISEAARLLDSLEDTVKTHLRSGLLNLRRALQVEGVTT
jgi:RNA polymerase sigma-70 factor, ECF subfamily